MDNKVESGASQREGLVTSALRHVGSARDEQAHQRMIIAMEGSHTAKSAPAMKHNKVATMSGESS